MKSINKLEIKRVSMTRTISDEVASLTVDTEEVSSIWKVQVVVTITIDDVNWFKDEVIS